MYKLGPIRPLSGTSVSIQRLTDNVWIPFDEDNIDYQKYLEWVAKGNTPLPPDEPPTE